MPPPALRLSHFVSCHQDSQQAVDVRRLPAPRSRADWKRDYVGGGGGGGGGRGGGGGGGGGAARPVGRPFGARQRSPVRGSAR
jgi:uncharacterized membrane protein